MNRLIDADVLIEKAHQESKGMSYPYREDFGLLVEWIVDKTPVVQPQQIVRCKDCKWCEDADGLMCKNPASWVVATDRDFGCVLAERRTDA